MSGHPDCPMCEVRTIEDEDGIMYGRKVRCTGAAGCVLKDTLIDDLLAGFPATVARREAKQAAARAREERIKAAQDAVLEAAREWWRIHGPTALAGHNPFVTAIRDMVAAEAEGETP